MININKQKMPDGYRETIERGIRCVQTLRGVTLGTGTPEENISRLSKAIDDSDAIVIGAGAGLSTSAGFTYDGERFERYFADFSKEYGITDMYSGSFYDFGDKETFWGWLARVIYFNRYVDVPKPVYKDLLELVKGKDYFVITTNVDHQFQRAGFDKDRLFYTQGDYGVFQDAKPKDERTFDNEGWVMMAMEAEGFVMGEDGTYRLPEEGFAAISMRLPTELIPADPDDGSELKPNLRGDDSFVENDGWRKASAAYSDFLYEHSRGRVLYLELGVGGNTPVIIKYPFWQMTLDNPGATFACVNYGEAFAPKAIEERAILINGDIGEILHRL